MQLTPEQTAIIVAKGNIKINAVAGSGKTTTIIEYAKRLPVHSKILYLAFNRTVKLEADRKFVEKGLTNVTVETAHSLAFKHIVYRSNYKVKANGYKTHEIAELLGLQASGEKHAEYIVANHINKFLTYFCNSDQKKVHDLNYLNVVKDAKAKTFVTNYYDYIQQQVRLLLSKMNTAEIEIIHDFYLKKFQLSNPHLSYDYILFDEGQDASAAMLDVFINQPAVKVIVGDTHQQIYGWRYAINSIDRVAFDTLHLGTSFRFAQPIANLAMNVLEWKNKLDNYKPATITGAGTSVENKTKAVLARTNLGLLLQAIEYVNDKKDLKHIYFEGNINSYTYADEGASLYDVLHLNNGNRGKIKDKLIASMNSLEDLEEYIEKTEDMQLGMMVEIVKEYGDDIFDLIKTIKSKHVGNDERNKAEIIFSTVHRSKGMEYDAVHLVNDFINEEKLEKSLSDKENPADKARLNEEINLLYVAITRAKYLLHIPETLLPKNYTPAAQIRVLKVMTKAEKKESAIQKYYAGSTKNTANRNVKKAMQSNLSTVGDIRRQKAAAFTPWTEKEDAQLTKMYCENNSAKEMELLLKRTAGAIRKRIKVLELEELYG